MPGSPRTISVVARGRGRLSRLRLVLPDQSGPLVYDAALARELLARTAELPSGRRALVAILTEYRRALHDLAAGHGEADPDHRVRPLAGSGARRAGTA